MQHRDGVLDKLLFSKSIHAQASLKYELRQLEAKLGCLLRFHRQSLEFFAQRAELCWHLGERYLAYSVLKGGMHAHPIDSKRQGAWDELYGVLLHLKQELLHASSLDESRLLRAIAALYCSLSETSCLGQALSSSSGLQDEFYRLLLRNDFNGCILGLIQCWNKNALSKVQPNCAFQAWTRQQQSQALDFFSSEACVYFINALCFYKSFPEHLVPKASIERVISYQLKLERLHALFLHLRQQLFDVLALHELKARVDLWCPSKTWPAGIQFQMQAPYQALIVNALKLFKISELACSEQSGRTPLLYEFIHAYKFNFNPRRLIDLMMVLEQQLKDDEALLHLYQQLSTADCFDLYGYFSNRDSRALLQSLQQSTLLTWQPELCASKRRLLHQAYTRLQFIMEGVRHELRSRGLESSPYPSFVNSEDFVLSEENRQAILHLLAVYQVPDPAGSRCLEQLFQVLEDAN